MNAVSLPPDLEDFAAEAVATGRYRDFADVVQAGLSLLRLAEAEASAFMDSLEAARAEGERDGFLTADDVHRDMHKMIEEMARPKK